MKLTPKALNKGFTLIELMIVIAIVAILATVAIPSYQNYTKKAAISELLQAAAPFRSEVELCAYNNGGVDKCNAGAEGIQSAIAQSSQKYLNGITVQKGVINVTGKNALDSVNYSLTASFNNGAVSWAAKCSDNELFPAGFCS